MCFLHPNEETYLYCHLLSDKCLQVLLQSWSSSQSEGGRGVKADGAAQRWLFPLWTYCPTCPSKVNHNHQNGLIVNWYKIVCLTWTKNYLVISLKSDCGIVCVYSHYLCKCVYAQNTQTTWLCISHKLASDSMDGLSLYPFPSRLCNVTFMKYISSPAPVGRGHTVHKHPRMEVSSTDHCCSQVQKCVWR